MRGYFQGWLPEKSYGFIRPLDGSEDVFVHINNVANAEALTRGCQIEFSYRETARGRALEAVIEVSARPPSPEANRSIEHPDEEIEDLDVSTVDLSVLTEIAAWKREAKAEDSYRYFWHVREVDDISQGKKYFIIGRKGSGKTALCEHFKRIHTHNVFSELDFGHFGGRPGG